jgi:hypothetical protein
MANRTVLMAVVPLSLLLAVATFAQTTPPGSNNPPGSSAPAKSSSPKPVRKPRIDENQDNDAKAGAITPSTPGTSRTPGTPGSLGTPDHPGG